MKANPYISVICGLAAWLFCLSPAIAETDVDIRAQIRELLTSEPELVLEVLRQNPLELIRVYEDARAQETPIIEFGFEPSEFSVDTPESIAPDITYNPQIDPRRPVRGDPAASVTIVKYSDFFCSYCAVAAKTIQSLMAIEDVRVVFKHMPLSANSHRAALAFEALALQSQELAWKFHDVLFAHQDEAGVDIERFITRFIQTHDVSAARFATDRVSPEVETLIEKDLAEVRQFNITGAPSFIVNGVFASGALPLEEFRSLIAYAQPRLIDISLNRPLRGNPQAPVTLVLFVDLLCPYCAKAFSLVNTLLEDTPDLRFVIRHMPVLDDQSSELARVFEALALQSHAAAWSFITSIFSNRKAAGDDVERFVAQFVQNYGIDSEQLAADRASDKVADILIHDVKASEGLTIVPTFLINGHPLHGLVSRRELQNAVENARSDRLAEGE